MERSINKKRVLQVAGGVLLICREFALLLLLCQWTWGFLLIHSGMRLHFLIGVLSEGIDEECCQWLMVCMSA